MTSEPFPIRAATQVCRQRLQECASQASLREGHWADNRSSDFNLWDSGVGACANEMNCLDKRLERDISAQKVVISALNTLAAWTTKCRELAEAADSTDGSLDHQPGSSSKSTNEQSTDLHDSITLGGAKNTVEGLLKILVDLEIAIRRAGTVSRVRRADRTFSKRKDHYAELSEHLDFILRVPKAPRWNNASANQPSSPANIDRIVIALPPDQSGAPQQSSMDSPVDQRSAPAEIHEIDVKSALDQLQGEKAPLRPEQQILLLANIKRADRFLFYKGRQEHLQSEQAEKRSQAVRVQVRSSRVQPSDPVKSEVQLGKSLQTITNEHTIPVRSQHSTGTTNQASDYLPRSSLENAIRVTSPGVAATTIALRADYPKPPKDKTNCPYCLIPFKGEADDENQWRKHASEDLQPYTCYLPNCPQDHPFFNTFGAWKAHVLSNDHQQFEGWTCLFCRFSSKPTEKSTFLGHIQRNHSNAVAKESLPNFADMCCRYTAPALDRCPVCSTYENDWKLRKDRNPKFEPKVKSFLEHLGQCIHYFALRVLPGTELVKPEDGSGQNPTDVSQIQDRSWPSGYLHVSHHVDAGLTETDLEMIPELTHHDQVDNAQRTQAWVELSETMDDPNSLEEASVLTEAEKMYTSPSNRVCPAMRLLERKSDGDLVFRESSNNDVPAYAILSHTWLANDNQEVDFQDVEAGTGKSKPGWKKIQFCADKAAADGLRYFWMDTCCINKANHTELSEALASMFRWYRNADKCYVYLADMPYSLDDRSRNRDEWESAFRQSKWFTRGWTLQELLAPATVEFFSQKGEFLGSKRTLEGLIHDITQIPIPALRMADLLTFSVEERLLWAEKRKTGRQEDKAYCLFGIFNVVLPPIYGEGEHAFQRLKEEIAKRYGTFPSEVHTHWTVTRPLNPFFTGHEDILQELDMTVKNAVYSYPRQTQCRIVITGMGGQGKSEICLQLAHRLRQMFWGVFWIDVSTTSVAKKALLNLAHKLEWPVQTWHEACLEIANLKHPWLMILDNADDPSVDYQEYIPSGPLGVVLLTSRNEDCQQYASTKPIALEGLSSEDARLLLLKAARVPQDQYNRLKEDAQIVANLLQSHPLALIQAGAYVSRGHCNLAGYLQVYERQRQRLLAFRPRQARSRYGDVYATFEASADILKTSGTEAAQDALQLLPLLAVCGPSRLPMPLFEAGWHGAQCIPVDRDDDTEDNKVLLLTPWHVAHLPSLMNTAGDEWDSYRLMEAVQLLKASSLVSTNSQNNHLSVSMHPLIHAWARDRQEKDEQHKSWLQMGCLMAIGSKDRVVWKKHEQQLQSHIETLVEWDIDVMFAEEPMVMVARILVNCGWVLHQMRSDAKLFLLTEKIFDHLRLDQLGIEGQWLGMYDLKAWNLVNYGKVKEAVPILERVVKIWEQALAENHPDRLASQHALAGAYQANGQVKEAVELLERVVKIWEQALAENHPSRLASQHALAEAYKANGQVKEAVELLERVVKIREQALAENHPDQLASQHELARAYQANGQVKEAVELLERVVKIWEQALAENHPDQLASQHALAGAYQANGQVKEAVELLERVVKIREQALAENHPDRLASQHALAGAYQANGQVKDAVELLERVVKIREQALAENHPDRLASQHALAGAYEANGQVKDAVELLERVVKIREQALAENHPDRLASQHVLAGAYRANGQVKDAVELLERVVKIEEQALAENHPDRLASQHALAGAYEANGQVKDAVELLERVVKIQEQALAENHPNRLASQHALAGAYRANGQVKDAVELLERVVKIQEQALAENHPSRLASQNNLAIYLWELGSHDAALGMMAQVVEIRKRALDESHPDRQNSEAWLKVFVQLDKVGE